MVNKRMAWYVANGQRELFSFEFGFAADARVSEYDLSHVVYQEPLLVSSSQKWSLSHHLCLKHSM
jgi:hypothetical protein